MQSIILQSFESKKMEDIWNSFCTFSCSRMAETLNDFQSEIFDLQWCLMKLLIRTVISDFYLQIHMNNRLRSLVFHGRKLSVLHCEDADFYISPPELPKSVYLSAQQSDSLTNMTNYVLETLLSPAEWTQSVCLNSQPSGGLTNLTNYLSEPL